MAVDAKTASQDVAIGQIVKPFGVRGDVRVRSLSDVPGRFESLRHATLLPPSGAPVPTTVRSVRPHGADSYVMGFEAFSTPEDAAKFRGALITVPYDQTIRKTDELYECDVIGLTVRTEDGRTIGTIQDVMRTPAHPVFVVRNGAREILIPATRAIVAGVDHEGHSMTIRPVDGLLDESDDAL